MNAFVLFKAVHGLPQLAELEIIGVEVQHTGLFAKCIKTAREYLKANLELDEEESAVVGDWK